MRCQDYQKWISRSVDNELGAEESRLLDAHLAECDACRKYRDDLMSMRTFFNQSGSDRSEAPSANLRDRVLTAVRNEQAGRNTILLWARAVKRACAAALILAGLTIGSFYIGGSGTIHAVDTNREIHYEDVFRMEGLDNADMLEALLKTTSPRSALNACEKGNTGNNNDDAGSDATSEGRIE